MGNFKVIFDKLNPEGYYSARSGNAYPKRKILTSDLRLSYFSNLNKMKQRYLIIPFILLTVILNGQQPDPDKKGKKTPANEYYTLSGFRHGVSFFPLVKFPEVQYEPGDSLSFNSYHSRNVIYFWINKWAKDFPSIVDLYEVAKSYEGKPILQMTLTNRKKGKDTDKPAAFFEGGRHSGEVTGSECVMWLARYLLINYGKNPEITNLLDKNTIYLRPINNPDGHDLYMHTAQFNRSTTRPEDNDNDGLLDEDPPDDLDGDGHILTMRWKDEKKGNMVVDTTDPTGRLLKKVPEGRGVYLTASEGIDNDGDSRINEDGIGGLDLHRNYPENWRPMKEETNRGFTQSGAGEYPLSESETRSVVDFLLKHPNISIVNSMDTSVPMHLRPPSTSPSEERMYKEDLDWYRKFDKIGQSITGYKKSGDVYNDYGDGNPLFGHGPDFGYWYYGAIWYGDEIWNGARFMDYNNDGDTSQIDILRWDDVENDSAGFFKWKPVKHPVYGDVELGGFDYKFLIQNPPAKYLEEWIKKEALFNLEMVKYLPDMSWDKIEVKKIRSYKTDSTDFQLKISVRNSGRLPTALKQAQLVKIVRNDRIELEFDTTGIKDSKSGFRVIEDKKNNKEKKKKDSDVGSGEQVRTNISSKNIPFTQGNSVTEAVFVIRLLNRQSLKGKATFYSTRGGVLREQEFLLR